MMLEMQDITKKYGNVIANDKINISLNKGEILAIVGENGAGKSTIMKILYGLESFDSGKIILNGKEVKFRNPRDAMNNGIGMVQQHFMLFESLTVAENVVYRKELKKSFFYDKKANIKITEELSKKYKLKIDPNSIIENCPVGLQQRVEILKILYQDSEIIIFDEPSGVLTPMEVDELLKTIKHLSKIGKSIIIITHKLNEVMEVSDRIIIMRKGKVIGEKITSETSIDEISYLMVGRHILNREIKPNKTGDNILKVENLVLVQKNSKNILDNINFNIQSGEIVGIAGVSGNGQSELIECITGLKKSTSGKIKLLNKDITNKSVIEIRKSGLSHIPEDRYKLGSAKNASLFENALMGKESSNEFSKNGILKIKNIKKYTQKIVDEYGVKIGCINQKIRELSGGNAQKLISGREILMNTSLIIACEPTRGIDIGAMEFIHNKLIEKRNNGDSVLLVSSELSEILELCDRIYTIYEGKINKEFKRGEASEKDLGFYMVGGNSNEN